MGDRGGQKVFAGAMKYFRQLLIGHEIFLKIFDELSKNFLCASFLIFFFFFLSNFFKGVMGVWAQNVQTSHQRDFRNKVILKISKIHLVTWQMLVKIKNNFLMCLDPAVAVFLHYGGKDIYYYDEFSWGFFICLTPFLQLVWIDKLHYFYEGIYSPNNGCHWNRIKIISQLS